MSFLQKTKFRMMKNQSQPASVVKIRRIRGHEYLIKKIKRPVQDEHKKAMHTMPQSYLHPREIVRPTKVTTPIIIFQSPSCHTFSDLSVKNFDALPRSTKASTSISPMILYVSPKLRKTV
jgi:hypothetical protein